MSDAEVAEPAESAHSGTVETELSRDMGLSAITFIGVGAMIGAGVFALTGFAAGIAGPALTLAFVLNGFVALFTAMSYAELGAAFPEAGGGYLWVKEALRDPNGFYAGWMSWFAHAVACSLYAVTFGTFFVELVLYVFGIPHDFTLFGLLTDFWVEKLVTVAIVGLFAYINYRGAEETGTAGIVVTTIKLVILGLFVVFGAYATFTAPDWSAKFLSNPSFAPTGIVGIIGAMGFTYIAFEGYEIIVQSGEEVVDPGTNIPKAVFYSLAIVIPIYVLVAFVAIGGVDVTQRVVELAGMSGSSSGIYTWQILGKLGELGLIRAAGQFMPYGTPLLLFAGLAATVSALNATVYSSSRVSFAMGRDRVLPAVFDTIHPRMRTPHWAIALSGVLIVVMAVTLPIESVAAAADIMFILLFVQVNWTAIKMRKTHPDLPRTFRIPYMPYPPLVGIVLQFVLTPFLVLELGLTPGLGPDSEGFVALVTTAVWMALGLVVYYGYSRGKEIEQLERETPTVVSERHPGEREYQLVVPVANPETLDQLMRTAVDIARERGGEILVTNVVTVPPQTPIEEGKRFVKGEREIIDRAIELAEAADVPVSGTIRVGHDIATAVLNTVEQHGSDAVLIGWRGRPHRRDFVLGSNVDRIVSQATCDVLVERISRRPPERVESVLVPTAGGPHAEYAAEIARAIARANDARVDVVTVVPPDASEKARKKARERVEEACESFGDHERVEARLLDGSDVVESLVESTADYDLTVIGATDEGLFQRLVFGAIPEEVGRRALSTVVMAKRNVGLGSQASRLVHRN